MRVDVGRVVVEPDDAEREADHRVIIERADNLAAGLRSNDEGDVGLGLEVGLSPDFALDIDTAVEFFELLALADDDV